MWTQPGLGLDLLGRGVTGLGLVFEIGILRLVWTSDGLGLALS